MKFKDVILHPGMMHTMMSFLGSIGTLMKGSGLEQLISSAFGGIASILNGKCWTNSLRAYRFVVAALLQGFLSDGFQTDETLFEYLSNQREHPTGKLWVDCFILPVLLALRFLRAEREGDFLIQQECLKDMLPYFFAAGHQHYARYITWYLRQVQNIPREARTDLLSGALVCRHHDGGPAVSADQFGKQTYIKQGKSQGGLKGISTSEDQVAVWVHSHAICSHLSDTIDTMYNLQFVLHDPLDENMSPDFDHGDEMISRPKHKEEGEKRRQADQKDRDIILMELQKHAHPLTNKQPVLYNIVNGQVASSLSMYKMPLR